MPRHLRPLGAMIAVSCATALSGCSLALKIPTQTTPRVTRTGAAAVTGTAGAPAATHNEVPTPPGPDEPTPAGAPSAPAAVRTFATRYINWTAADLRGRLERLAADSVGQARSAMALAAAQTGSDPELAQAGVANHGVVEAVAALPGGRGDRWVVVTRESTTATRSAAYQGLAPQWHLAVATTVRRGAGWVISGWQPEN